MLNFSDFCRQEFFFLNPQHRIVNIIWYTLFFQLILVHASVFFPPQQWENKISTQVHFFFTFIIDSSSSAFLRHWQFQLAFQKKLTNANTVEVRLCQKSKHQLELKGNEMHAAGTDNRKTQRGGTAEWRVHVGETHWRARRRKWSSAASSRITFLHNHPRLCARIVGSEIDTHMHTCMHAHTYR